MVSTVYRMVHNVLCRESYSTVRASHSNQTRVEDKTVLEPRIELGTSDTTHYPQNPRIPLSACKVLIVSTFSYMFRSQLIRGKFEVEWT